MAEPQTGPAVKATVVAAGGPAPVGAIVVKVIPPAVALLVRFANTFLTTWLGLVGAAMTPAGATVLKATDFAHLAATCASLSVAAAAVDLAKNLVTVFGKLEGKYPLLTGSV